MNKYIYTLTGGLAALIIASSVAIFNPALAQDFVYMPFFGVGDSGIDVAGVDDSLSDAADADLIPLTPLPVAAQPPTRPSEQDIEALKEFAKNEPPKEEVIVYVGGPETKGQEILWPKANSRGRVQLPPDVWSTGHQLVMCHHDEPDCESGIAIAVKRDNSTLTLWTLNGRVVDFGLTPLDPVKRAQLRAEFPEIFAQLDAEANASE